ncbi:hypothetical protein NDU88_008933 [Pleurodeles waltl]|uniref:Uncharacterized protein n=1 Tax=Pleurodeles waltl TaxID=8319 RepID=A0AAV7PTH7_PLEWA|nr:hypothetical protein NDU88_008933 [Pleurodeles waltl]
MQQSLIHQSLGQEKVALERNGASLDNVIGTVVSQVSICVLNQIEFQILGRRCQASRGDPSCVWGALRFYELAVRPHLSDPWPITFPSIDSLCVSPPIKSPRLWRRSRGPAPDRCCAVDEDTAIAGPV